MLKKAQLIQNLIEIKSINVNFDEPYHWASGIEAPIYLDNRLILSYPNLRSKVVNALKTLIIDHYESKNIDIIFGTATAGIAHAALVSEVLGLPCGYVRNQNKNHGRQQAIEGLYWPQAQAIVIEDTVSTGNSVLKVVRTLQAAGVKVLAVVAIFNYNFKMTQSNFAQADVNLHSLLTFQDLLKSDTFADSMQQSQLHNFYQLLNQSWS